MKKIFLLLILLFSGTTSLQNEVLWNEENNIYSTKKKYKAGDTLKIIFNEKVLVNYRIATSDTGKITATGEGGSGNYINFLPKLGSGNNFQTSQKASTKNKGELRKGITVKIDTILPDGTLQISGTHSIQINNMLEQISIKGKVNPVDIRNKKYIYSTDVLDPTIIYKSDVIKPPIITAKDYIKTYSTNISVVSGKTQVNITSKYEISENKRNQLIIEYLNKILSILFR